MPLLERQISLSKDDSITLSQKSSSTHNRFTFDNQESTLYDFVGAPRLHMFVNFGCTDLQNYVQKPYTWAYCRYEKQRLRI